MNKLSTALFATCLSFTSAAFAAPQLIGSFDDMRTACKNPAKYHNQNAPQQMQASCGNVELVWVPAEGSMTALDTSRHITAQISSDKYTSSTDTRSIPSAVQQVSCPSFKQVLNRVEALKSTTCEEILAFEGTAIDYCKIVIDSLVEQNPEAVQSQDTGRIFNMCGVESNPAQQQAQTPAQQSPAQQQDFAQQGKMKQVEVKKEKKRHFGIFR